MALEAREQRLRETVWAPEVLAQECGRTIEHWWDTLNASPQRLLAAADLPVGEVRIPAWSPPDAKGHGLWVREPSGGGAVLSAAAWRQALESLDHDGWRLQQTEFRHVRFQTNREAGPGHSVFEFTAHLTNALHPHRASLEGNLTVHWVPDGSTTELRQVRRLDGSALRLSTREGPPPFEPWLEQSLTPPANSISVDPLLVHDLDGDGRPELVLSALNRVYRLDREGRFQSAPLCAQAPGLPSASLIADFTGDAVPDFLTLRYDALLLFPGGTSGSFEAPGLRVWTPPRDLTHGMAFTCGDMDRDGDLDLFIGQYKAPYESGSMPTPCDNALDGWPAYLLRNDGGNRFQDATPGSGLEPKRHRRSYSASFADLDHDRALDLVVVSDFAGVDVYRGDGRGHFEEVTSRWLSEPHGLGMGHALSDFNADGLPDLILIGMQSPTVDRLAHLGLRRGEGAGDLERWRQATHGNRLWRGRSDGSGFEPWPLNPSATRTGWSWGCTAADFDNDGWPDLAVANGMESRLTVRDYEPEFWLHDVFVGTSANQEAAHLYFQSKIARTQGRGQSYGGHEKNRLLLNQSGHSFLEAAHLLGVALEQDSRNLVGADLDADGRQDLVVTTFDTWPQPRQTLHVFRNTLPETGPWIGFHLPPAGANSCGATVTLSGRGKRSLRMYVTGDSHRSQHPATAHFGLGELGPPETAEIRWASGALTRMESPAPGRYHTVPPPTAGSPDTSHESRSP